MRPSRDARLFTPHITVPKRENLKLVSGLIFCLYSYAHLFRNPWAFPSGGGFPVRPRHADQTLFIL